MVLFIRNLYCGKYFSNSRTFKTGKKLKRIQNNLRQREITIKKIDIKLYKYKIYVSHRSEEDFG